MTVRSQPKTKRLFCFGKEEGRSGYGVSAALTQTAETEWSEFLLTSCGHNMHAQHAAAGAQGGEELFHAHAHMAGLGGDRHRRDAAELQEAAPQVGARLPSSRSAWEAMPSADASPCTS